VSDAVGVESMIAFAEQRHSRIDVLVNLAGGYDEPVFPEASPEHWRRALDLNLVGTMLASQAAFHSMRGRGGAIVNVASSAGTGTRPYDGAPEYAAAKAGVVRLTTAFAECDGVRMNCVSPDWVATPAVLASLERMSPEERAAVPELIEPAEIAEQVVRFVRDDSLAGRVVVLWGGEPPRLLPDDQRD
jgi:NAD(P)-dependent dehydrogenase (short-subunit alcohol dehydrogenase family)